MSRIASHRIFNINIIKNSFACYRANMWSIRMNFWWIKRGSGLIFINALQSENFRSNLIWFVNPVNLFLKAQSKVSVVGWYYFFQFHFNSTSIEIDKNGIEQNEMYQYDTQRTLRSRTDWKTCRNQFFSCNT